MWCLDIWQKVDLKEWQVYCVFTFFSLNINEACFKHIQYRSIRKIDVLALLLLLANLKGYFASF